MVTSLRRIYISFFLTWSSISFFDNKYELFCPHFLIYLILLLHTVYFDFWNLIVMSQQYKNLYIQLNQMFVNAKCIVKLKYWGLQEISVLSLGVMRVQWLIKSYLLQNNWIFTCFLVLWIQKIYEFSYISGHKIYS